MSPDELELRERADESLPLVSTLLPKLQPLQALLHPKVDDQFIKMHFRAFLR